MSRATKLIAVLFTAVAAAGCTPSQIQVWLEPPQPRSEPLVCYDCPPHNDLLPIPEEGVVVIRP
jgi:hypothetical protein